MGLFACRMQSSWVVVRDLLGLLACVLECVRHPVS